MRRWSLAAVLLSALTWGGGHAAAASVSTGPTAERPGWPPGPVTMELSSPDFAAGAAIPVRFTCQGAGDRPTLNWSGVPARATSLAIVVTDPEATHGTFTHWIVYGLPASAHGSVSGGALPPGAREGENTRGKPGWAPPCPPSGNHHYHFVLYADHGPMPSDGSAADTVARIRKQAVGQAELIGTVAAK